MNIFEPVEYHTDQGIFPAVIILRGHKRLHVIIETPPLRIKKVPLTDERLMTPLERKGAPYPIPRLKRLFLAFGRKFGMNKSVRRALA